MSEILKCNRCGAELPPDSPEGLCPRCLLALNLATQTEIPGETGPTRPPPAPPLPVAKVAKLFPQMEIIEFLGRGGMGAVYKARQPRLDRFVALKILSPEKQGNQKFAERFEREARALAKLHHPNIVAVYDFGEAQGNFYLLMEYVDGATLRQLIAVQKLSSNQALVIVPKICDALQYAHGQGIVHRDIKPENILIDKGGGVKIADFGIAKILGDSGSSNLTAEQVIGTPHYMSPEQIEKPQTVDHRADIYSLGVVFYEMLTGELPLGKFPPPSRKVQVDVRLDEVVLRALEKEPEHRYQQASEVKSRVETIAGTPRSSDKAPVSWDRRENYFWRWAAGIVLSLIASLVLYACIMSVVVKRTQMNAQPHITLITSSNTVIQVPMPAGAALMIGDKKINPVTGLPMAAGQVQLINPATGLPMTPGESGAINPATGLPANASGKDQAINPATGLPMTPSQTQTINPATGLLESAQKPDAQAELQKAQDLMNGGDYEGSLQTFISYFNDSKFEAGQAGVRLSFALSDWVELGRRYPKAKEALIKIRDNDTQKFAQGQGYFDLFSEVSAINQYLGNQDATYQLFKSIESTDPQLAGQCYFDAESLLVEKGDYTTARKYMGDPERTFETLTNMYRIDLQNQARMKALNADTAKRMAAMRKKNGWTNLPAFSLPDTSAMMLRSSHDRFTGGVRQLIEILVATGDKPEAENIQNEALGVLDDLQLHSAVEDAEAKLQESGENTNTLSDDLRHAHEELAKLRINYGEQNPEVKEVLARIQELERISKEEPDLPPDLREARVHLAELRAFEGPENPDVQGVSARIKELERMSKEEPGASPELREAKASLAELLCHYGQDNPVIQQAKTKIQELESESAFASGSTNHPQVIYVSPANGAADVDPQQVIRIRFDQPMNPNDVQVMWLSGGFTAYDRPRYHPELNEFDLPVQLVPGKTNRIWASYPGGSFQNTNAIPADSFKWEFTTKSQAVEPGTQAPKVIRISPMSGDTMPVLTMFEITFDQPMTFDNGYPYLRERGMGFDLPGMISDVEYAPSARQFTVPVILPPDNETKLTLEGFYSVKGVASEPVVVRCNIDTNNYSDEQWKLISKAADDPRLKELLANIKAAREKLTSGIETVEWTTYSQEKNAITSIMAHPATFKWQGTNQIYADISDIMEMRSFILGTDGQTCWLYANAPSGLNRTSVTGMADIYTSIADPFDLIGHTVDSAIEKGKLMYVGQAALDGHECDIIKSWHVKQTGNADWPVMADESVWWIDEQTYLPVQLVEYGAGNRVTYEFHYDGLNQPLPASAFQPPVEEGIKAEDWYQKKLGAGDKRYFKITDGGDGQMSGRIGIKSADGSNTSSGLN